MAHSDKTLSVSITEYLDSGKAFRKYSTHYGFVRLQAAVERMLPENIFLSKLTTAIIQTAFDEFQKNKIIWLC